MGLLDKFWKAPEEHVIDPPKQGEKHLAVSQPASKPSIPVDVEFDLYFEQILSESNISGPDYYEFRKALADLKDQPISEAQKFVVVFSGFKAQGVSVDSLVEAAQKYITTLHKEKEEGFDLELKEADDTINKKVGEIQILAEENEKLNQKIQANSKRIFELGQETTELKAKLQSKTQMFQLSFNNFIQRIAEDIEKIKNYLGNGITTKKPGEGKSP